MPKEKREEILAQRRDVAKADIEYGDRNTQFVIIGTDLSRKNRKKLDECLLNSSEMNLIGINLKILIIGK